MIKLYKLTDEFGNTMNNTHWGENVSHTAIGKGQMLCSNDVIHAYESPLVAILMNCVHGKFTNPILWEAEGEVIVRDGRIKCGVKTLTTLKKISLPVISIEQRVKIAIHCSLAFPQSEEYKTWAEKWLSGENRTHAAANRASCAAHLSALDTDTDYLWRRVNAAAQAAESATALAAQRGNAALGKDAEAFTALAADCAAQCAKHGKEKFDLIGIIEKVMMD